MTRGAVLAVATGGLLAVLLSWGRAPVPTGDEASSAAEWDCAGRPDIGDLGRRARLGDADAQHMFARAYRMGRDVPQDRELAMLWYRRAAEQGHAGAQAMLGRMHWLWGEGTTRDVAVATDWYRRSAEQGHPAAQFWLGDVHSSGGTPHDQAVAAAWYRRAAEQGHAMAQWGLGNVYAWGRGVPQDDVEAITWYALAAAELPLARNSYEDIAARLDPAATAEARRRALAFRPIAEIDPGCVP